MVFIVSRKMARAVLFAILVLKIGWTSANSQFNSVSLPYVPSLGDTSPGSVWPQPQALLTTPQTFRVAVEKFWFSYNPHSYPCSILTEAFRRYEKLLQAKRTYTKLRFSPKSEFDINTLDVKLKSECEKYPSLEMDESYDLTVGSMNHLQARTAWGILRGLETFSQLLWEKDGQVVINQTTIIDFPRFAHRGILLDTSRHYLPVSTILRNLDAMAYNKFNVFHWHIVDDTSFPFVSQVYPDLSEKGSYSSSKIYTPSDVAEVIEYARLRGIRVVPEFDTPGHTQSWGKGQPDLLTPCYTGNKPDGKFGPINPDRISSYAFINNLFKELREVFPDKYLHIGGDEVRFSCWKSNPDITKFMKERNITGKYSALEQFYIEKVADICEKIGFSYIVWQEVIDNGISVKNDTVVEVWKRNAKPQEELAKVTKLGYRALITAPWYLNVISYGENWKGYYTYEPLNFKGTPEQKALVIGGEACMWGEWVDATNILPRLWPRASAVAERLWSAEEVNDIKKATPRLHQHRCTLLERGIPAEPLHPGFCKHEWRN